MIAHFQKYPQYFDAFVEVANKDSFLHAQKNKLVRYGELGQKTKEALLKLNLPDIAYVTLGGIQCHDSNSVEIDILFSSNWHLQYESCLEGKHAIGSYQEQGSIESWELGSGWRLWVNNDFIG